MRLYAHEPAGQRRLVVVARAAVSIFALPTSDVILDELQVQRCEEVVYVRRRGLGGRGAAPIERAHGGQLPGASDRVRI